MAYIVVAGERYGKWAVAVAGLDRSFCRCDCGNECHVLNKNLVRGVSTQCKSCGRAQANRTRFIPLPAGSRYGSWTVLEGRPSESLCRCVCGKESLVQNSAMTQGRSTQCRDCCNVNKPHRGQEIGLTKVVYARLNDAVANAIGRCTDPSHRQYSSYGGRGITVHEPWLEDIFQFVAYLATLSGHDDPSLWLDRENNDKGYEPGNLCFVTPTESNNNKREYPKSRRMYSQGKRVWP